MSCMGTDRRTTAWRRQRLPDAAQCVGVTHEVGHDEDPDPGIEVVRGDRRQITQHHLVTHRVVTHPAQVIKIEQSVPLVTLFQQVGDLCGDQFFPEPNTPVIRTPSAARPGTS